MKSSYNNKGISNRSSYDKGRKDGVDGFAIMMSFILADKWGWGHTRQQRLVEQIGELADSINNKYVSLDDIKEALLKEHNIIIDL